MYLPMKSCVHLITNHSNSEHEPSSFLKRGHKPQSIRTIRVDLIESSQINNIFNPPSKSRSTVGNRVHESISGLSNRKYQRRIESSWVYWTALNKCTCFDVWNVHVIDTLFIYMFSFISSKHQIMITVVKFGVQAVPSTNPWSSLWL